MKKNLFLYLFIFAVLFNIFTYMYFTSKNKFESGRIEKIQANIVTTRDSLKAVKEKLAEADYFSLENNDNAMEYFEGQDIAKLTAQIRDGIYAYNENKAGNTLVDYPAINGVPFLINKVKILNNRWVIADFSNGTAWGEVLIKYFVDSDGKISYESLQTNLYSGTVN